MKNLAQTSPLLFSSCIMIIEISGSVCKETVNNLLLFLVLQPILLQMADLISVFTVLYI